jgi:glycosyltransferase involved in cell wall biosynthesis
MPVPFILAIIFLIFAAMLNIGFDAKRAFLNSTGLGNYSRSVITSLSAYFPENNYFLYTPKDKYNSRTATFYSQEHIHIRKPAVPLFKSAWRTRFVIPRLIKDKLQVYHGLSHEIPSGIRKTGIRSVVTMHDLIFLRYPQYYKPIDRKIYETKFRHACTHADRIIAISQQTKKDLVSLLGAWEDKIEVIYQTCDKQFLQKSDEETRLYVRAKYSLPKQYLLNVGTIEDRKNLLLIAKALPTIRDNMQLVVIGKQTPYAQEVRAFLAKHQLADRVTFLDKVDFADLPALYQQAEIFIYPSEFEGFGIPILEALYSGVPVIAATGSCLEEAGGPDSLYIHPKDEQGLSDAVNRVLDDNVLRKQMITRGKIYAAAFTEENHARQLMQTYKNLL